MIPLRRRHLWTQPAPGQRKGDGKEGRERRRLEGPGDGGAVLCAHPPPLRAPPPSCSHTALSASTCSLQLLNAFEVELTITTNIIRTDVLAVRFYKHTRLTVTNVTLRQKSSCWRWTHEWGRWLLSFQVNLKGSGFSKLGGYGGLDILLRGGASALGLRGHALRPCGQGHRSLSRCRA